MKKIGVILSVLGLLLLASNFLVARGKSGKSDQAKQTEITYAFWGEPEAIGVEQTIIDGFNGVYPQITVKPIVAAYNQYQTKLLTLIGGGSAPDVMRIDSNFRTNFIKVLMDLNPIVAKKNFDLSMYHPEAIADATTKDGKLIGLPWGYAPFYYFINLEILQKYGMELPPLNWTISDFYRMSQEVYEKSEGEVFGIIPSDGDSMQYTALYSAGTDYFTQDYSQALLNSPKAISGFSRYLEMYRKGVIPADSVNPQYKSADEFISGRSLFFIEGSSAELFLFKKAGMKFEAWTYPTSDDGQLDTTMVKSNTYSLYKDTKKPEQAWNFLTYHRGPEGEKFNAEAKRVPPSIADDELVSIYADIQPSQYPQRYIEVYDAINNQGYAHPLQLPKDFNKMNRIFGIYWQKVLLDELPLQGAMDAAAEEINTILQQ